MTELPLIVAGCLTLLAAAVHGAGGEILVVRRLTLEQLPPSAFGGPRMTKTMIRAAWHITTVAFLVAGVVLVLSGSVLQGDVARATGLVGAAACTGFAAVVVGVGAASLRTPRALLRHPGPVLLTATAALAWWGAV